MKKQKKTVNKMKDCSATNSDFVEDSEFMAELKSETGDDNAYNKENMLVKSIFRRFASYNKRNIHTIVFRPGYLNPLLTDGGTIEYLENIIAQRKIECNTDKYVLGEEAAYSFIEDDFMTQSNSPLAFVPRNNASEIGSPLDAFYALAHNLALWSKDFLWSLNISNCQLDKIFMNSISRSDFDHRKTISDILLPSLKHLDISNNNLGRILTDGAADENETGNIWLECISKHLRNDQCQLTELNLSGNALTGLSVQRGRVEGKLKCKPIFDFFEALHVNTSLVSLDISGNLLGGVYEKMHNSDYSGCGTSFRPNPTKSHDFLNIPLNIPNVQHIEEIYGDLITERIIDMIRLNKSLVYLDLTVNRFDFNLLNAKRMLKALNDHPYLLSLTGAPVPSAVNNSSGNNKLNQPHHVNQVATDTQPRGIVNSIEYETYIPRLHHTEYFHTGDNSDIMQYYESLALENNDIYTRDWRNSENIRVQMAKKIQLDHQDSKYVIDDGTESSTLFSYPRNGETYQLGIPVMSAIECRYQGKFYESSIGYFIGSDKMHWSNITILDISCNPAFGDSGVLNIVEALRSRNAHLLGPITVRSLRLCNIGLTASGMSHIISLLEILPSVCELDLSDNRSIKDQGIITLLRGLLDIMNKRHLIYSQKNKTKNIIKSEYIEPPVAPSPVLRSLSLRSVGMSGLILSEDEEILFAEKLLDETCRDPDRAILREIDDYSTVLATYSSSVQFWLWLLVHHRQWPDYSGFQFGDKIENTSNILPNKEKILIQREEMLKYAKDNKEDDEKLCKLQNIFDYNAVRTAALQFMNHSSSGIGLKMLDISGNALFCEVISDLTALIDNTPPDKWCRALAPRLDDTYTVNYDGSITKNSIKDDVKYAETGLTCLRMSDVRMGKDSPFIIAQALENTKACTLKYLDIGHNSPCGKRDSNPSQNTFDPTGILRVADVLKNCQTSLITLNLSGSDIGARSTKRLLLAISENEGHLRNLLLDGCNCSEEGGKHIGAALETLTRLQRLSVSSCNIGPVGGKAIIHGLCRNKGLLYLDLSSNQLTGYLTTGPDFVYESSFTDALSQMEDKNTSLISLDLRDNRLFGLSLERHRHTEGSLSVEALKHMVVFLENSVRIPTSSFKSVNISENRLCNTIPSLKMLSSSSSSQSSGQYLDIKCATCNKCLRRQIPADECERLSSHDKFNHPGFQEVSCDNIVCMKHRMVSDLIDVAYTNPKGGSQQSFSLLGIKSSQTRLSLSSSRLCNESIRILASEIKHNHTLQSLDLAMSEITEIGVQTLAEVICHNISINSIKLPCMENNVPWDLMKKCKKTEVILCKERVLTKRMRDIIHTAANTSFEYRVGLVLVNRYLCKNLGIYLAMSITEFCIGPGPAVQRFVKNV
jgi:hypothetical protein